MSLEIYDTNYVKDVMGFVESSKSHPNKKITQIGFTNDTPSTFIAVFGNKDQNGVILSKTVIGCVDTGFETPTTLPSIKRPSKPRIPWTDEEIKCIAKAKSAADAGIKYREAFPNTNRKITNVKAHWYMKNLKKPRIIESDLIPMGIGDKVRYKSKPGSSIPHPVGTIVEIASKGGKILVQFSINDKKWGQQTDYERVAQ